MGQIVTRKILYYSQNHKQGSAYLERGKYIFMAKQQQQLRSSTAFCIQF